MRSLILAATALCLTSSCALAQPLPTQLPASVTVDDQVGISTELAYQAASLAERTAIKAGFVTPARAKALIALDNEAYTAVCTMRTAYDVANNKSPSARVDGCPASTKANRYVAVADAARQALAMVSSLVATTQASQR